ncbi:phosphate transporter 1 [Rhynchospora pubera]|uniref:H(+)/Pi cotransporter n=1 Tax=Rhynchospora pubera TaxID=906938 RepID=A0AAV8DFJ2_9POAL|nr:phosphate transporter 1 [Rhynchospora pubera]
MGRAIVETTEKIKIDNDIAPDVEDRGASTIRLVQYSFFSKQFFKRHGADLAACSISWFLLDVVFYIITLFQSWIYKSWLKHPQDETAFDEAFNLAKFQAIYAIIAALIPGYIAAIMTINRVGRRKIQMVGFLLMAIVLLCMVIWYPTIDSNNKHHTYKISIIYLVMYGLVLFFANLGPNTTTFVLPAELFPARFRTTCHGIAGAAGKIGAIIGSVVLLRSSKMTHKLDKYQDLPAEAMKHILIGLTLVCFVGTVHTYFFTPKSTVGTPLEEHED